MTIAESIKNLRAKYNLTQEELAKIAGVSVTAVSKWEIGHCNPRMGAVEKMASAFGLLKSDIMDGTFLEQDERTELLNQAFAGRPEMRLLFDVAENASVEEINQAIRILRALKGE